MSMPPPQQPPQQPQQPPAQPHQQAPQQAPPQPSHQQPPQAPSQQPPQPPNPYQQNPYAQQPPGAVPPAPYPQAQPQPGFGPPGAVPGGPAAGKRPVPGWLWGLGGVVVASAVWGGVLFGTGALDDDGGGKAALGGYRYQKNLCDTVTIDALKKRYEPRDTTDPTTHYASRQKGLDANNCSWSMKDRDAGASDYSSVYVYATAQWHKSTDPTGEFASLYKQYEDRSQPTYKYETKAVDGLGDEAYLVTERRDPSGDKELSSMTLAVRDGWFTYELRWSWYGGTSTSGTRPPSDQEAEDMLRSDTRDALAALKKS
ncbi:hypothetical protein GCM10018785_61540 [Streptomyces longispororuber]|uniref:Uncharacterized protein n=1 Tax=Streptomyces longispororuber TaxID=68230 RepID=A0A919A4S2_9ACTN|nr:hypothetical protein [Streptomyces longispororuber]GHE85412.1 hypothetical protein GCM10018785_61540 [Streptomyces longispororuber]